MESPSFVNTNYHHHHQKRNASRPYRSKRHPPCDQCRRKKLRCDLNGGNICERCQVGNYPCSFGGLDRQTVIIPQPMPSTTTQQHTIAPIRPSTQEEEFSENITVDALDNNSNNVAARCQSEPVFSIDSANGTAPPTPAEISVAHTFPQTQATSYQLLERPTAQAIQTLDLLKGFSSQLAGASGESDPFLLRHAKFDDHGFLLSHQVHFRNAGGVPLEEKIPVHFLVSADHLYEPAKEATRYKRRPSARDELNELVSLECGQRLVALWVIPYIYIFVLNIYFRKTNKGKKKNFFFFFFFFLPN